MLSAAHADLDELYVFDVVDVAVDPRGGISLRCVLDEEVVGGISHEDQCGEISCSLGGASGVDDLQQLLILLVLLGTLIEAFLIVHDAHPHSVKGISECVGWFGWRVHNLLFGVFHLICFVVVLF